MLHMNFNFEDVMDVSVFNYFCFADRASQYIYLSN